MQNRETLSGRTEVIYIPLKNSKGQLFLPLIYVHFSHSHSVLVNDDMISKRRIARIFVLLLIQKYFNKAFASCQRCRNNYFWKRGYLDSWIPSFAKCYKAPGSPDISVLAL